MNLLIMQQCYTAIQWEIIHLAAHSEKGRIDEESIRHFRKWRQRERNFEPAE